ncbi:hypothetical protein [Streptomyces sp. NPDC051219]|uniref:hypothetical protein n=1 Tax=Streptomyces sp. NPDC051219 TaxID=3155283 RepID=UPI00341F48A8
MRPTRWTIGLLAAAALLLTGCTTGGGGTPSDTSDRPAASAPAPGPGPTAATGTPTPAPAPTTLDERLVTVTVTGGIAGRHDSVLVNGDGTYTTLTAGKTGAPGRLTPAELTALRTALKEADFPHLPRVSMGQPVPDAFIYAIRYQGHEVVTSDPAPPPALRKVLAAVPLP